jgi:very-short-patch-repair endonuclease
MKGQMWLPIAVFVVVFIAGLLAAAAKRSPARRGDAPKAREPLTRREQEMFRTLAQAFPYPQYVVLSQVAFTALITARAHSTRNGFNRKVADFVLCDAEFRVIAAIELDDSSHKGRENEDASRDAWLTGAGYRVLRYANVPTMATLLRDVLPQPDPVGNAVPSR